MKRNFTGIQQVGKQRFQENPGLNYEDFSIGDHFEHWPGRTITETDNIWFTNLTMNTHPLHLDNHYGSKTEFGRCLVNSTLTVALVLGLSVKTISQKTTANLGWESINLPAPVFSGDTIYCETVVLDKRESKSRNDSGIIKVRHIGKNQNGQIICEMIRSFLIPIRGFSTAEKMQMERVTTEE